MPNRYPHRKAQSESRSTSRTAQYGAEANRSERNRPPKTNLTHLIEQDAPLQTNSLLVLMYGPFQAEMAPGANQGVASWIKECLRKHGLPSLVRFDCHRRAQIFRRDQFQPWLEPLMNEG